MNMTYDAKVQIECSKSKQWIRPYPAGRRLSPIGQISNAVKGWQQDVENIAFNPDYNNQTTKNALLPLMKLGIIEPIAIYH